MAKVNPFEKKDKAADKRKGITENSRKDVMLDIKMMAAKAKSKPSAKPSMKPTAKAKGKK